jgi:beta-aspartyl-peptidase (threonine type)
VTASAGVALAVHGGAGRFERGRFPATEADDVALRHGLAEALRAGAAVLARGGDALDAVVRAVAALEEDARWNAGLGAVLTAAGGVELDAAVMDGCTRAAGAVACVTRVATPVALARRVLERTPHVLLAGPGADAFAAAEGFALVDPAALAAAARRAARMRAGAPLDPGAGGGTVGAVARDARGHLAAATSTGGVAGQLAGRVGDSPVPGAGTWADDATCAVSATGAGEAFLRCAFAHEVDAGVRLAGLALDSACEAALARVGALGAAGGCIALGRAGEPVLRFTSVGMARGVLGPGGRPRVALYADESLVEPPEAAAGRARERVG